MAFEVVLWSMEAPPGKLEDTERRARQFEAEVAATLPRPWKDRDRRSIGTVRGVRTLVLTGGTVSVLATVELDERAGARGG